MTPSDIAAAFAELGFHPSKALGQNFLHDTNVAKALVGALGAAVGVGSRVVEIGPGLGALTAPLLDAGAHVLAIEKDRRLAGWLGNRFPKAIADGCLEVVRADALEFDTRELMAGGPFVLVGNLPYNVSTPLLFKWTVPHLPLTHALVTLQVELARRLTADPSTSDYGELSILLQRRFAIRMVRRLPPTVFLPRPGVDSGAVLMESRPWECLAPCDETLLRRLLAAGFGQRRKQLRKAMEREGLDWMQTVTALGIARDVRAENLSVEQWVALAQRLAPPGVAQSEQEEIFDVVDENDRPVGRASREQVHAEGLRHRSVHILVENDHGEVWLQRRSPFKDRFPGRWDSSAAGHVDAGESYEMAAHRELREELGVDSACVLLGYLNATPQTGNESVALWRAHHNGPFRSPAAEIDGGAFFTPAQIARWIVARPDDFAPGFLAAWQFAISTGSVGHPAASHPAAVTARRIDS